MYGTDWLGESRDQVNGEVRKNKAGAGRQGQDREIERARAVGKSRGDGAVRAGGLGMEASELWR